MWFEYSPRQAVGIAASQQEKVGKEGTVDISRIWMQIFQIFPPRKHYQRNFKIEYEYNFLSNFQDRS